ncbi:hypothetical protein KR038_005539 [Drosophila bunnanda]|nr:hypothetical protein KR038_005539 [Drosophila bunnanda]
MNNMKMMQLLMIFGFTLLVMQPAMGNVLPLFALGLINSTALKATDGLGAGKVTNGTTAATTTTTTTITTLKPMTTNLIPKKKQQQTAKGAATATTPGKDVEFIGYLNDLFDLEDSMRRKYQKRRSHGASPTKPALGGSIVANPLMYYNMAPPGMQAARIDLELSYKPGQALDDGGTGAPSKHNKSKGAQTLPPLLEMLSKPQQHPEMPAIMEFLNGIVELVINSSSNSNGDNESKPYGYINKTVSPDGKHQRKEFGIRAPNMVIKGVQQETNYGLPSDQDAYEVLSEVLRPSYKPVKVPNKLEQEYNYGMPSELNDYEALDFLGPAFKPVKMTKKVEQEQHQLKPKHKRRQQHRREQQLGPQYELLHDGIDMALRNNYEMIDRLLEDLEQEDELLQVIKDATNQLSEETNQLTHNLQKKSHSPKEELILSCPIHHEFHADRYGDIIEEDVVEVDECEAVKIQD